MWALVKQKRYIVLFPENYPPWTLVSRSHHPSHLVDEIVNIVHGPDNFFADIFADKGST